MHKVQGFFDKAKGKFGDKPQQPLQQQPDGPSSIQPPSYADVQRYRYHHGANVGSLFILERWLSGCMFADSCDGSAELAAVEAWVKQEGVDSTRQRFERHWHDYLGDADLDWLRDVGRCTTIRLPIGYFTLGPPYCEGTPFGRVSGVYENAWAAVKRLVGRCHERGIGVLVDLHGLPGGANAQDHSGTNSGKAEFWASRSSRELATRCLCFIAQQARQLPGVAGVQVVNEAEGGARGMFEWYEQVLAELARVDPTMPVYVSDAWDLGRALDWSQTKNSLRGAPGNPVVVDTHLYWAFSDADKQKTPRQITAEVQGKLGELDGKDGSVVDRGAAQAVVGEYSCVLTEDSWAKAGGSGKEELVREFGNAESRRFQQRAGGSFFWTYRMDWMPGGEWGFRQMTEARAIVPPASLTLPRDEVEKRVSSAQSQLQDRRARTVGGHRQYWDGQHPGNYEHWRFEQGWDVGFNDAMQFFGMRGQHGLDGADGIGMLDLWCLKRIRESGQGGGFVWEFEQGLRQGVRDFGEAVGT